MTPPLERWMWAARARLRALVLRRRAWGDIDAELREHADRLVERYAASGLGADEARRAARRDLGGLQQLREACQDVGRVGWLEDVLHDLKRAVRQLARSRGFAVTAVATMAVGIGANTAVFTVVNAVLLKPLPFADSERLVGVWHSAPGLNIRDLPMAPSLYVTYREQNRTFEDIGLWDDSTATVTGLTQPEQVESLLVTDGTLSLLGVSPAVGRRFVPDDHVMGSAEAVMLTYDYWQSRFGGDAAVVGLQLTVNGRPREVIGVLPRTFRFLNQKPALLLPLKFAPSQLILGFFNYQGVARLKPGATIADANADVARMLPIWLKSYPPAPGYSPTLLAEARPTPDLRPFRQDAIGDVGRVLWIVMGTLGVVLLIACANVANLLLVRAERRRRELAVRVALGAGRWRIARELLCESAVLGLAGGGAGLAVAYGALRLLVQLGPSQLPRLDEIAIDPAVLLFALAVSLLSGLLFGIIPALKYAGMQSSPALQSGGRTQTASRDRHCARGVLVVVQVALALVLLISAGLIIRSFVALRDVRPGFARPEEVQTLRIIIPEAQVRDPEQVVRLQQAILDNVAAVPGVVAAAFAQSVPMDGRTDHDPIVAEGIDSDRQMTNIRAYNFVSPGFFEATGIRMMAGRDLTWVDVYERRPVALVSEGLARDLWGDPRTAVGKRVRETLASPWRDVIGVVADVRDEGIDRAAPALVYFPTFLRQFLGQDVMVKRSVALAVRSPRAGSGAFLQDIRQAVWAADPDLPLADVRTLRNLYDRSMARTSFALVMLAMAGTMALLLGLVGIYAVMSSSVSQRTQEIGIRIALGAHRRQVLALVHRDSLALTVVGVAIGLAGAVAATRLLAGILFGVTPLDPGTFTAVALMLTFVAMLAAHIPARRAARLDPTMALRHE